MLFGLVWWNSRPFWRDFELQWWTKLRVKIEGISRLARAIITGPHKTLRQDWHKNLSSRLIALRSAVKLERQFSRRTLANTFWSLFFWVPSISGFTKVPSHNVSTDFRDMLWIHGIILTYTVDRISASVTTLESAITRTRPAALNVRNMPMLTVSVPATPALDSVLQTCVRVASRRALRNTPHGFVVLALVHEVRKGSGKARINKTPHILSCGEETTT